MTPGLWVLVAALLGAGAFGSLRTLRDGRFRARRTAGRGATSTAGPVDGEQPAPAVAAEPERGVLTGLDHPLGERATLLQFSSAFCAPCRATRRVLGDVAETVPGVAHIEVDAESQLDLVRRLGILRTPTTLVLDARGREVSRAAGAPSKAAVLATLARSLDA